MTASTVYLLLLAHLAGDYLFQSHWMATEKTKRWWPAIVHAVTYGVPFLMVTRAPLALAVIVGTHAVIDRYQLARHVMWAKNQIAPKSYRYPWSHSGGSGYHTANLAPYQHDDNTEGCVAPGVPDWLAVWLLIIADNTLHVGINYAAVRWL